MLPLMWINPPFKFFVKLNKKRNQNITLYVRSIMHPLLLCVTINRLMDSEMTTFLKRLSDILSSKWERPYSATLCWVRTKLSFVLVRAASLCIIIIALSVYCCCCLSLFIIIMIIIMIIPTWWKIMYYISQVVICSSCMEVLFIELNCTSKSK